MGIKGDTPIHGNFEGYDARTDEIVLLSPGGNLIQYCPLDFTKAGQQKTVDEIRRQERKNKKPPFLPGVRVEDDDDLAVRGLRKALE